MEKRTSGIWLKWVCLCLLFGAVALDGAVRAQGVPGAVKYQAVLRDVEGEPMANRGGLSVRITLRQGSPDGTILYKETHTDLTTDAFGLLQLEIGRGEVEPAAFGRLLDIPWENSPVYAEVEVQDGDHGYTMMGASELLAVPYALYAGNANVGLGLDDGVLPKYDAGAMGLVNSRISEQPDGAIMFQNGQNAYFFPTERGREGQSLTLIDEAGQLGWRTGGGGGVSDCPDCQDGYMTYYDRIDGLKTGTLRQETDGVVVSTQEMRIENELEINATVSGTHNLRYDDLAAEHVWVGNDDNRGEAYGLAGSVTVDNVNKRLLFGGSDAVWVYKPGDRTDPAAKDVVHTALDGLPVRVGVGTDDPQARFHLQDGSFLLSGLDGATQDAADPALTAGNHLYWHSGKGALRMGWCSQASVLWDEGNLGEHSIALGTEAKAGNDNVAIGKAAEAQGTRTMVFGQNVAATGSTSLAMGHNVLVSAEHAIGIGVGQTADLTNATFVAGGAHSVTMGYEVSNNGDDVVAIGQRNTVQGTAANSVVIGMDHHVLGESSVAIGNGIKGHDKNSYNVQVGSNLEMTDNSSSVNIGANNNMEKTNFAINLGNDLKQIYTRGQKAGINIGLGNEIGPSLNGNAGNGDQAPVLIGQDLTATHYSGVILGYNNDPDLQEGTSPALIVGADGVNAMELYENGNLYAAGDLYAAGEVYAKGVQLNSDLTLKTDIQPLNADISVLQALQPVRYRFKADKKQALQFGFIAQDVEQYFPHLVHTDGKGLKSLNYIGLLPVLWQYTQQLEQTVETQATEIDRLKTELDALKAEVEAVKAALGLDH